MCVCVCLYVCAGARIGRKCRQSHLKNKVGLLTFERKCRTIGLQLIVAADATKDMINHPEARILGRHKAANLRKYLPVCNDMST